MDRRFLRLVEDKNAVYRLALLKISQSARSTLAARIARKALTDATELEKEQE